MSIDSTSTEYHLTPNGWITGTFSFYGNPQGKIIDRPHDTVETWIEHEKQMHINSAVTKTFKRIWKNSDILETEILKLHDKYPKPTE